MLDPSSSSTGKDEASSPLLAMESPRLEGEAIDELMGHQRSQHGDLDGGSRIGARYWHTTEAMAARVVDAMEARLTVVLKVAEEQARAQPWGAGRVF